MYYHFQDEIFYLSLLEFCIEAFPFEPQCSHKADDNPCENGHIS